MRYFHIGIDKVNIDEVWEIGKGKKVKVEKDVLKKVKEKREKLEELVKKGYVFYGINTGVGRFADKVLEKEELKEFQIDLVKSHSAGYGEPLPREIIRMAMFLRLYMLSKGYSGVRPEVLLKIEEFLNKNIVPFVPSYGSLGASGDLIPLSHIALALTGGGKVYHNDNVFPTYLVLKSTGTEPLELEFKEALSLLNGIHVSLASLIYSLKKLERALSIYDIAYLFSFIAIGGNPEVFDSKLISLRNSKYEEKIAEFYRKNLKGYLYEKKRKIVQDPYSFRCMPQIRGACEEILNFCKKVIEEEIESISDNPILIEDKVISGGNFMGVRLSFVAENLKKIMAVLSNISERRINHLMGSDIIDMPKFLSKDPGKKSGLMLLHSLVVSLLSYIKTLTFPDLSDSIPTSGNQEDYVPMTMNSCLKLMDIIDKFKVIALSEFYSGVRAVILLNKKLPETLQNFLDLNFKDLKILTEDRPPYEVIENLEKILFSWEEGLKI